MNSWATSQHILYPLMMNHPASDISKVLKSKKNLKTKKNFQFRFNNIRRENGSVGTVLSAEENTFPSYTQKTKNWYKVVKTSLKPCSVKLTRLSQAELISSGYKTISKYNQNVKGNTQLNDHCNAEVTMRKSVNNQSLKSSVDKTQLHLELEKVASTFASEVKEANCLQYEDYFDNNDNFPLKRKENAATPTAARKAGKREQTNIVLKVSADNVTQKNQQKKQTRQKSKASAAHLDHASGSESDEEEWLGWNSKVTPLDIIPGAEIVSVEENQHVEDIINWNMKVESESDMDVEEVFLVTDLEEINHKTACTESVAYSSDEDWPGWPEQKPSTALCYVFNV